MDHGELDGKEGEDFTAGAKEIAGDMLLVEFVDPGRGHVFFGELSGGGQPA